MLSILTPKGWFWAAFWLLHRCTCWTAASGILEGYFKSREGTNSGELSRGRAKTASNIVPSTHTHIHKDTPAPRQEDRDSLPSAAQPESLNAPSRSPRLGPTPLRSGATRRGGKPDRLLAASRATIPAAWRRLLKLQATRSPSWSAGPSSRGEKGVPAYLRLGLFGRLALQEVFLMNEMGHLLFLTRGTPKRHRVQIWEKAFQLHGCPVLAS